MSRPRSVAVAAACLALALPGAALADSAGDNQYQDPLGNTPSQQKPKKKTQSTTQTATPTQTPASSSSAPSSTAASTTTTTAQNSGTLPRTGMPVVPLVVVGVALIAGGVLIRRLA
jgi:LPXTG-motif cell wall-anchored protein